MDLEKFHARLNSRKDKKVSKGEDLMVMLRLANFYIASIRKTLRAVNVMTARDLARIQKDGGGGPPFVYTLKIFI